VLRYRNLLVRAGVQMQNKIAGLLLEMGVEYETPRLHRKKYFGQLLEEKQAEIPASARRLLAFSREQYETLHRMELQLLRGLEQHPEIAERVARLMTIPGVGPVLGLTWALEVGPVERLGNLSRAISFCGLCSALRESAGKQMRGPISKQRNVHLQTVLIEAAHLAPRWNPLLAAVREREIQRGHRNRATLAVARKLVAFLMAADRGHHGRRIRGHSFSETPPDLAVRDSAAVAFWRPHAAIVCIRAAGAVSQTQTSRAPGYGRRRKWMSRYLLAKPPQDGPICFP
jgi:transposase